MTRFVIEILQSINEKPEIASQFAGNQALRFTLEYAFDKTKKMVLPEGDPPYRPDSAPLGMSEGNYQQEARKLYVFCRDDISAARRESLFIQLLEGVHPSEAEMILAVKNQQLGQLFPNITYDLISKAGLLHLPEENVVAAVAKSEDKPRGKGRPPGSKNKAKEESLDNTTETE